MRNFFILTEAIDYIESQLCEPVTREDIAAHCYVSLSSLEKLFRYTLGRGIKEYITKRRMTLAARDLVNTELSVTDIAFKYQYNSVEVFTRTFKRVWLVNPSEFSEKWRFTELFPKINYEYKEGEDRHMARRRVDMSEAYDFIHQRKGSYVLCFDMEHMMAINEVSYKAGDMAIIEEAGRIDAEAGDDMLLMRIGGDEFALITGLYELDAAQALLGRILAKNGQGIDFEGKKIVVNLYGGITTIPERPSFDVFFKSLHETLDEVKK